MVVSVSSVYLRSSPSMKSAARRLSAPVRRSTISFPFSSGMTRMEVSPKTSLPSMAIFSFRNATLSRSHTLGPPDMTALRKASLPDFVVITKISSGTTGCAWCASAQTVSVSTAGDVPMPATRMVRLDGPEALSCAHFREPMLFPQTFMAVV